MSRCLRGIFAGFVATAVLSALMALKAQSGYWPDLDVIGMLASMANSYAGLPRAPAIGWGLHFFIGTIAWGVLFGMLAPHLLGPSYWLRGIVFALGCWLAMMALFMPLADAGLFGNRLGAIAPVLTLALHVVFGAVIGYAWLPGDPQRELR